MSLFFRGGSKMYYTKELLNAIRAPIKDETWLTIQSSHHMRLWAPAHLPELYRRSGQPCLDLNQQISPIFTCLWRHGGEWYHTFRRRRELRVNKGCSWLITVYSVRTKTEQLSFISYSDWFDRLLLFGKFGSSCSCRFYWHKEMIRVSVW